MNNFSKLEIIIATIEIQIMSIKAAIDDILKAFDKHAKTEDYFKWYNECEKAGIELLKRQKESESVENE